MKSPRLVGLIFALIITVAGVGFVASRISEISDLGAILNEANVLWLLSCLICQAVAFAIGAYVWWRALVVLGTPLPFTPLYGLSVAKLFSDQAVPSAGLSGAAFLMHALTRRNVSVPIAMTAFVFGAGTFIAAFCLAGVGSIAFLIHMDATPEVVIRALRGLIIVTTAVVVATTVIAASPRFRSILRRHMPDRLKAVRNATGPAIDTLRDKWRLFIRLTGVQIAGRCADAATLACACAALGAPVGVIECFVAVSIGSLAATVAPLPMGVGPFEGASAAVLTVSGLDIEAALASILLFRGFSLWLPLVPGFAIAQREVLSGNRKMPTGHSSIRRIGENR
ncbi:MAG: lysylphosphatidylglycerol synthase transmembrane domain-containing protein [Pseudomonadota bacterium]